MSIPVNGSLSSLYPSITPYQPQINVGQGGVSQIQGLLPGDNITYDPSVSTGNSGIQSALSAQIGEETIAKFSGGAATVTGANKNTVADENGELYGLTAGSSGRKDLGADTSQQAQQAALGYLGGTSSQGNQELTDVIDAAHGDLSSAPTVAANEGEFGAQDNQQLVNIMNQLINTSQTNQAGQPTVSTVSPGYSLPLGTQQQPPSQQSIIPTIVQTDQNQFYQPSS